MSGPSAPSGPAPSPPATALSCSFCGSALFGATTCPRCGTAAGEAPGPAGVPHRQALTRTRAVADLLFLLGLLAGGPLMTVGGRLQVGLFLVLGGGFASVLRRHTALSTPAVVLVGVAAAGVVAAAVLDPPVRGVPDGLAVEAEGPPGVEGRTAYVEELDRRAVDGRIEARGPGAYTVWFLLADTGPAPCGTVPDAPVREHLAELGFKRVVVADRGSAGGLCSFRP